MTIESPAKPGRNSFSDGEVLYRLLFENGLDGLMLTAPDGSIFDANPAACRILCRSREEIMDEGRQGLIDSSDPRLATMIAERQSTGKAHGELSARRRDGTLFPVEISSVVFSSPAGEKRTCIIIRDITERKAAEAEREHLIGELQQALRKVKSLSGLLPICASCKKIRNDHGYWEQVERYFHVHGDVRFTHSICPQCFQKLYGNLGDDLPGDKAVGSG